MTAFQDKRVVVTGGAGFIGSHLVDALLAQGAASVAVVDTFFLGKEANLAAASGDERCTVYREDAADLGAMAAVCQREQPDMVLNLATKALLYSFFNPAGACRVNVDIALTLCELLRGGAYGRLVHLSSSEVYGTAQTVPMTEDHPLLAETTYAAGKAAADLTVAAYGRMFDVEAVTIRPFNNFGPRQNEGSFAGVIPFTVRRVLDGKAPLIEGDGHQTRDFIFVADTVDAILRVAAQEGTSGLVLNLGSGQETEIETLVTTVARMAGYEGPVDYAPARVADVRRHCASVERAEALVGPIARTPLDEGLRTTVDWYLQREGR